jgi:membrane protease YdiL (CAAX protease family)
MTILTQLTFFSLMMTFLSLWIHKTAWLWGAFLAISLSLAFHTGIIQPFSFIPICTLFVLFWALHKPITGVTRWILISIAIALAAGLNFHLIPGFHNCNISARFWLNYDKPFMGLFSLVFLLPLLRNPAGWYHMALKAVPLTILSVLALMALAFTFGVVGWDFKAPSHALLRLTSNLFLVTIPEEAFFRGFVQEEIFKGTGQGVKGYLLSILGASLLFTLFHLGWTSSFAMLGFVFLASILYGIVYQYTRAIESSILCHFVVNFIHMTFFTYHAL